MNKRKLRNAIKTCFYRIENEMRINSIISIGNIGAKYPGYVRDIKPLIDIIYMSNLKLKKKLNRIHNREVQEWEPNHYRYLSTIAIQKICKANPDIATNKIIKKLISKLKGKGTKTCRRYWNWRIYKSSLAETIGIIANKNDYALFMLKELLVDSQSDESKNIVLYSLRFACDNKNMWDMIPLFIDNIENYNSKTILTKIGIHNPNKMINCLKKEFYRIKSEKNRGIIIEIIGKLAVRDDVKNIDEHYSFVVSSLKYIKINKGSIAYALGLIASVKPELIEDVSIMDFISEHQWRALNWIASKDINIVFDYAKRKGYLAGSNYIAKSKPNELLKFFVENPEFADKSVFICLNNKKIDINKFDEKKLSLVIKNALNKDGIWYSYYISYAIIKYPHLFEDSAESICKNVEKIDDEIIISLSQVKNVNIEILSKINRHHIITIFSIIRKLGIGGEYLKNIVDNPFIRFGLIAKYAIKSNLLEKYEKDIIEFIDKNIHRIKTGWSDSSDESIMEGILVISEEKPELILKYLDDIISITSPITPADANKYCTMRAIHVLGNLIKYDKKLEDKLLPIILNNLDQWHYRIFNASKRVLKYIINNDKELIYKIETYLNDCENETIKRRAYNILKKVNQ